MNIPNDAELALEWEQRKKDVSLADFAAEYGITRQAMANRTKRGRQRIRALEHPEIEKDPEINEDLSTLDAFDALVLKKKGDPLAIIQETYNKNLNFSNAEKYLAGIRMHLNYKRLLPRTEDEINKMEELATKADGTRTTKRMLILSEEDSKDPVRVMELMGYDPLQWELISCKTRRNYWDVTIKNAEKRPQKSTNHAYMCVVTCRPIQQMISTDYIRKVFEEMRPPELAKHEYKLDGAYMLVLPIMDFHLGKLAWADETGEDHYDLKIAVDLYRKTVLDIIAKVALIGIPISRIIFPIGQDFFHADDKEGRTTSGTYVDVEGRWQKMYRLGVELLVWAVEQLRSMAPVECMYVPGNHDEKLSFCATEHVAAWYRETTSVQVDLSPQNRKYVRHGKVLIGFAHGKKEGSRIQHMMQVERPEDWGETLFREWNLGDEHHEESEEVGGVIIRRISAITATDAWHAEMGFKGSIRKAQAFIWDKELGKQFTIDSNVMVSVS